MQFAYMHKNGLRQMQIMWLLRDSMQPGPIKRNHNNKITKWYYTIVHIQIKVSGLLILQNDTTSKRIQNNDNSSGYVTHTVYPM